MTDEDLKWSEDEERAVFAEAAREIAGFPDGLREEGLALLEACDPARLGATANAISYRLPYWVGERTNAPASLCRDLAVGNVLAMLRYFLLDDAMDGEGEGEPSGAAPLGLRRALALAELLHGRFLRRYARHFPPESPLWNYSRKYAEEWASAILSEQEAPADPRDPFRIARKAAPAKLCAAALLLKAGGEDDIPSTEEAVDLALAVLQLSDDWADWREDLARPNGNAFLTLVRESRGLDAQATLDEPMVNRAIYLLGCADRLADIAAGYGDRLARLPAAPPGLSAFQAGLIRGLRGDARAIDEWTTRLALDGGFAHMQSFVGIGRNN